MQDFAADYLNPIFNALNYNLFALGDAKITPLSILYLVLLSAALIYLSRKIKTLLLSRVLQRTSLDIGAQQAIGTITRYLVLFVGFLIILQTVGINLTSVNVLAGAVGIGIGLGLQNIANNFISGLIILFERPIKVGDRVEVDKVFGEVTAIGARSTRIKTNDNFSIIVPNSKFISENVTNLSLYGNIVRFRIPVKVAYDSDTDLVERLLLEVAKENGDVVADPPPTVRLVEFGENALRFELRAWSRSRLHRPGTLKSNLNLAIIRKFRQHDVVIPVSKDYSQSRNGSAAIQTPETNAHQEKRRASG